MTQTLLAHDGNEYRLANQVLLQGVIAASGCALGGVGTGIVAFLNPDGSLTHPMIAALAFGAFWLCFSLGGVYGILTYLRERLFVSPELVRVIGCFREKEVSFTHVNRAVWNPNYLHGGIELRMNDGKLKIWFGKYRPEDRPELIRLFRHAIAANLQEGWEQFEFTVVHGKIDYEKFQSDIRGHLRFTAIAVAMALPFMYGLLIWQKLEGGLPDSDWIVVALLPLGFAFSLVFGMCIAARSSLAQARAQNIMHLQGLRPGPEPYQLMDAANGGDAGNEHQQHDA